MERNLNILVTSCGGDIGQSIGKILKESNCASFGLDISKHNAAQFVFDHFEIGPRVTDENYLIKIGAFVTANNIDVIIPVSEPELRFYTQNFTDEPIVNGAKVLMANHFSRKIGFNKTKTCLFLKENNLPNPVLYTTDSTDVIFPVIAKPNTGAGSANIFIVENTEEFKFLAKKYDDLIFQELLDGEAGEFTCCIYGTKNGAYRNIIFKRELTSGGYSGYGELVEDKKISKLLIEMAGLLQLRGSINVQLRIHNGLPIVFEINPRVSSTILFRHLLGFNDLKWSIEELLGNEISGYTKPEEGSCFYKGYQEYIK
jgi:carbamoyl-phosphate synthase large subunit